jgi:hypothetical protein
LVQQQRACLENRTDCFTVDVTDLREPHLPAVLDDSHIANRSDATGLERGWAESKLDLVRVSVIDAKQEAIGSRLSFGMVKEKRAFRAPEIE